MNRFNSQLTSLLSCLVRDRTQFNHHLPRRVNIRGLIAPHEKKNWVNGLTPPDEKMDEL